MYKTTQGATMYKTMDDDTITVGEFGVRARRGAKLQCPLPEGSMPADFSRRLRLPGSPGSSLTFTDTA